jgi:hypothetical protein
MLRSNLFFSAGAYRRRVKSPVEFAVGLVRGFEGIVPTQLLGRDLANLGQNLCHPPTTRGWTGGSAWISSATLVGRSNLANELLGSSKRYNAKINVAEFLAAKGCRGPEAAVQRLSDLFVQNDVSRDFLATVAQRTSQMLQSSPANKENAYRAAARAIIASPEFNLA